MDIRWTTCYHYLAENTLLLAIWSKVLSLQLDIYPIGQKKYFNDTYGFIRSKWKGNVVRHPLLIK